MHFLVKTINSQGRNVYDIIEEESYDYLLERLERQEVTPLSITKIPNFLSLFIRSGKGKITQEEVIELIENMHLVIKSGLPLHQGLLDLAEDSENKHFKNMLFHVADDIRMGISLSNAFEPYKNIIGIVILNFIRIGEETGQLQATLERSSAFLNRIVTLKKKAKSALIYPIFSFIAVFGAMLVWMIYVLPQMAELFKEMDTELPTLTLIIMDISKYLSKYIGSILIGLLIFIVIFKIIHHRSVKVRRYTDHFILKIPIIKQVVSGFNTAFISDYLRIALASGIPLLDALDTLKKNIGNEVFKEALMNASVEVTKGSQLSEALSHSKLFTPFMLRMMSVGESTGSLETQLGHISEYYNKKVDYYAENIGKFIEPVVLMIVGGFMALIMIGLMGPMYDLIEMIE